MDFTIRLKILTTPTKLKRLKTAIIYSLANVHEGIFDTVPACSHLGYAPATYLVYTEVSFVICRLVMIARGIICMHVGKQSKLAKSQVCRQALFLLSPQLPLTA